MITGNMLLEMAVCLAERYAGSPWYEDRVADVALIMSEAAQEFEPQDGEDTLYRRLVWILGQASGRMRRQASEEKDWAHTISAISDIAFEDEAMDDVWDYITEFHPDTTGVLQTEYVDGLETTHLTSTHDHYWVDANGAVLSTEDIADIVTRNVPEGEDPELVYQHVFSLLEGFAQETEWQIPDLQVELEEREPETFEVTRMTFTPAEGGFQIDTGSIARETVEVFRPDHEVYVGEEDIPDLASFGNVFNPTDHGNAVDEGIDPVDPAWVMLHAGNAFAKAYAEVKARGDRYGDWDSLRTWAYWYRNIFHKDASELSRFAKKVMANVMVIRPAYDMMVAADKLARLAEDYRGSGPMEYGDKRRVIDALVEQIEMHTGKADDGTAFRMLRSLLHMERYAGREDYSLSAGKASLFRMLEQQVLEGHMRPAHAIRIAALLDGANPYAARDWANLVYNHVRSLKEKLGQRAFSWRNELRIACTLYPSIYRPLKHRVLILTHDAGKALDTLKRLKAAPETVEIVTIRGSAAEKLADHGYTVTDFTVDAAGRLGTKWAIGQAAAYATWVWIDPAWEEAALARREARKVREKLSRL